MSSDLISLATSARIYDLEQPREVRMPIHPSHKPGYFYHLHRRHGDSYSPDTDGPRSSAAGILTFMEHSGTHIDALAHIAENLTLFGGVQINPSIETPKGFTQLGVEEILPIIARGVFLDIAKYLNVDEIRSGEQIHALDLQGCAKHENVDVRKGDVVLVRLGNARNWGNEEKYLASSGLARDASVWLGELGVSAVGADNMQWDVLGEKDPELGCKNPGHVELLARRGIYILENLYLEELSRESVYEFLFICTPLKFKGATGSPIRPIALK